jgi:ferredoxin-nitrite reductase
MTLATEKPTTSLNKFEKIKAEKDGLDVKNQLEDFAQMGWEAIDASDRDYRLKWLGVFFRPVTPGQFMVRMRMPHGVMNSLQMRVLAEIVERYGDDGNADITTRQNLQLRGIRLEDIPDIFNRFKAAGMTSIQSGMDNVRNITGSPVSGIDKHELIDTQELVQKVQDMITNTGEGNPAFSNLPRKFNIAIGGCPDNSIHAEINDIAFIPAYKNGEIGFNVLVGGFFSAKRCEAAIPLNVWVPPNDDVVELCRAILEIYRDNGPRANRQKSRLMWLIDEWGLEKFRAEVEKEVGKPLAEAAEKDEIVWEKRDHLGVFPQKQPGLNFVGFNVPVGRLFAPDMFELARLAEVYGNGEMRLTVEQNVIIPNIPDSRLEALLQEPIVEKFSIDPAPLTRSLVSCTGSQFCNFALIETKNRALALVQELEAELEIPKPVRIHWTGCPNSCGQPQVAEIGLMGTKTRKNGKTVEGVDLYMGGKVGKDAHLGSCVQKGIPCEDLKPVLRQLLVEQFEAKVKPGMAHAIVDAPPASVESPEPPVAKATQPAVISFVKSGKTIDCDDSAPILEIAEREGIELDSSCRGGTCGTCKQKLIGGEVRYENEPQALSEGDRQQGYILTCSAHPVGPVDIDA